jgi:5'-nucleotidase
LAELVTAAHPRETILVLSGVTQPSDVERYPYRPSRVVTSVADLLDEI